MGDDTHLPRDVALSVEEGESVACMGRGARVRARVTLTGDVGTYAKIVLGSRAHPDLPR